MKKIKFLSLIIFGALVVLSFNSNTAKSAIGLEVGDKIPSINAQSIKGDAFNLTSLKGKMVVVNFWASYDAESRVENFAKSNLIKKYKTEKFKEGDGLAFVSVSFDRFKTPLKEAIERDGLKEAIHLCDFKGVNSELAKAFGTTIPTQFLIDGNGFIIAKSSKVEDIAIALETYLKH